MIFENPPSPAFEISLQASRASSQFSVCWWWLGKAFSSQLMARKEDRAERELLQLLRVTVAIVSATVAAAAGRLPNKAS